MSVGDVAKRILLGQKLRSSQLGETLLPKRIALPVFASDALSSVAYAPDEATFDESFDAGHGSTSGKPVLAWTADRVYFPVVYDGAEWMGSAPRNPVPEGQTHEGGQ